MYALLICSVIGTLLSAIPFFFYDLDENKRSNMIKVLKIRAVFEDYVSGEFSEEKFAEVVKEVEEARAVLADRENRKLEDIEGAELTVNELEKFKGEEYSAKLQRAERLVGCGIGSLAAFDTEESEKIKKLLAVTKTEKLAKRDALEYFRALERSAAIIRTYFPDGIAAYDEICANSINSMSESTSAERKAKKQAQKKLSLYNTAVKPFKEAEALLKMKAAYEEYETLKEKYFPAAE